MNIYDQLIRDEGIRLKPYRDSVGKLTIGVGRNLDDVGIFPDEAEAMLARDIQHVFGQLTVAGYAPEGNVDPRFAVLLNMGFNMGVPGLLAFRKMLAAYKAGDYATAAKEMLDSQWATQVGARAQRLAIQMRDGVWT